jgi:hypothetical protein
MELDTVSDSLRKAGWYQDEMADWVDGNDPAAQPICHTTEAMLIMQSKKNTSSVPESMSGR